jgi:hypothetical protein
VSGAENIFFFFGGCVDVHVEFFDGVYEEGGTWGLLLAGVISDKSRCGEGIIELTDDSNYGEATCCNPDVSECKSVCVK